jgi:hypothetical protein
MNYVVYGGFEVPRQKKGLINSASRSLSQFWDNVNQTRGDLSKACGCYIFCLSSGGGLMPWYVGKAETQNFDREVFSHHKLTHYNNIVTGKQGTPYIYLIPRLSPTDKLCKPAANNQFNSWKLC